MSNKNNYPLLFLILAHLSNSNLKSQFNPYDYQASSWIQTLPATLEHDEAELIANVFYLSYQRAKYTIKVQDASKNALESLWFEWEIIAGTRRNPAHISNYNNIETHSLKAVQKFETLKAQYLANGKAYVICTDDALKGTRLLDPLKDAIGQVRKHARMAIFEHMLTIPLRSKIEDDHCSTTLFSHITNFIRSIPSLSIASFVEFDKKYLALSNQCWDNFFQAHSQTNNIWFNIENMRKTFYAGYYNMFLTWIKSEHPEWQSFYLRYDSAGYIRNSELELPNKI